ncbi:hypothetical protein WICMUC_002988 [Wickerhamomyces mucosus]|uniref:SAC3/GANP/THP3 conserved domain-containing protein n=1 Tax=Wickerhamomyces mucosus TaxID=1378264 RepID=A0A9P8PNJ9_9ASCO|nr:hypothetical protein WICMUC_002988 [Wickerhamomyces mucosus]
MSYNSVTPRTLGANRQRPSSSRSLPAPEKRGILPEPTSPNLLPLPKSQGSLPSTTKSEEFSLPKSLTRFVTNCHDKAISLKFNNDKLLEMQDQLRQLIEKSSKEGKVWTNDWSKQQLPIFWSGARFDLYENIAPHQEKKPLKKRTFNDGDALSSELSKKARAQRFERELSFKPSTSLHNYHNDGFPKQKLAPLVGTCMNPLKNYFRLTSEPDPTKVRPLNILRQSLQIVLEKYKKDGKYTYTCDQFKSMRQDLRVQNIEEEFTVQVYEAHAKIAIENKDIGEFNQCQTMLTVLYANKGIYSPHKLEYLSYKILYQIFTNNMDSIFGLRLKLRKDEISNKFIDNALKIFKAVTSSNYHELFRLYSFTTHTTRKLMDCFIDNERVKALAIICRSYKSLSLEYVLSELRFKNENDCMTFITSYKIDTFLEIKGEQKVYLSTERARDTINGFLQKVKKIDIKGQV